jgi:pyruvate/2-oxoglutarate dehydrogenase complex dihydrolipoamide acyltransferase (E2) component
LATEIMLPQIGFAMTEGTISEWLAVDGARLEAGQPLFVLEADKSVNEIEAPAAGILRILKAAGDTYPVGTVLGLVE